MILGIVALIAELAVVGAVIFWVHKPPKRVDALTPNVPHLPAAGGEPKPRIPAKPSPHQPAALAAAVRRTTMTEADVVEVLGWLAEGGAPVWLKGGWGVDALLGEQTREHKDLDLIVRTDDVSRMSVVLHEHGFRLSRGVQRGFVLRDERGRVIDVHPVRFDDRGNGHFESEDRGPFEHPAAAFTVAGNIGGHRVACLSAEAQMANHAWGYTPGDTDVHDMQLLNARLGTALRPLRNIQPSRFGHADSSRGRRRG